MRRRIWEPGLVAVLSVLLAACSGVPVSVDLLPHLPVGVRSGSRSADLPPGSYPLDLKLPDEDGELVDAGGAEIPGRLTSASFELAVEVTVTASAPVSGRATAAVYLAPEGADLWQDAYRLGGAVELDLGSEAPQRVEVRAALSEEQLAALNDRRFVVGVRVQGDVDAPEGGRLELGWEVVRAVLSGSYLPL